MRPIFLSQTVPRPMAFVNQHPAGRRADYSWIGYAASVDARGDVSATSWSVTSRLFDASETAKSSSDSVSIVSFVVK
jgi:hypothetical protein